MNQYLNGEIYNNQMKEKFTTQYTKNTKDFYMYIFVKSFGTESQLKKDICEFNNNELDSLIKSYNNESVHSVYTIVSILRQYIDFCVIEGFLTTNVNYLNSIGGYKNMSKYLNVTATNQKYINEIDLNEIINLCLNAQDAVIFALLFEGVKGEACEEIVNLKISDCNLIDNKLILTKNDGTIRNILVSDKTIDLISSAIDEREYIKSNGDIVGKRMQSKKFQILPTDYVLRISARKANGSIAPFNIIARLNRVKEFYGNPYLTVTNIWMSGMINTAINIVKNNCDVINKDTIATLTKEDYVNINITYGYSKVYWYKTRQLVELYVNKG